MALPLTPLHRRRLQVLRPVPKRAMHMRFAVWVALAQTTPVDNAHDEAAQAWLGESGVAESDMPPTA